MCELEMMYFWVEPTNPETIKEEGEE